MDIYLEIKSSSSNNSYIIDLEITKSKTTIFCNCPAGEFGKLCKHKIAVITGDDSNLLGPISKEEFKEIYTELIKLKFEKYLHKIDEAENQMKTAKKNLNDAKNKLAHIMRDEA